MTSELILTIFSLLGPLLFFRSFSSADSNSEILAWRRSTSSAILPVRFGVADVFLHDQLADGTN